MVGGGTLGNNFINRSVIIHYIYCTEKSDQLYIWTQMTRACIYHVQTHVVCCTVKCNMNHGADAIAPDCLAEAECLSGLFNTQLVVAMKDWKLYSNSRSWANRHIAAHS